MAEHLFSPNDARVRSFPGPDQQDESVSQVGFQALALLVSDVLRFVKQEKLFRAGDRVLIACSGGLDSTLLVRILMRLREHLGLTLFICHVHHGLRGHEADDDALFVKALASEHMIPYHLVRLFHLKEHISGISLQEAAREARYSAMTELAQAHGYTRIVVGHTASDQLETVIHHLARGTGLKGLCGIAPQRAPGIVRPFLEITRQRLEEVAKGCGLTWREDSSNSSRKYTRNRIRMDVLPALRSINPSLDRTLIYTARQLRREETLLSNMANALVSEPWIERTEDCIRLQRQPLMRVDSALRARLLRHLLLALLPSQSELSSFHIEELLRFIEEQRGTRSLQLPGAAWAVISPHTVELVRGGERASSVSVCPSDEEYPLLVPAAVMVPAGHLQATISPHVEAEMRAAAPNRALFSPDALDQPLCVRTPRRGDRFWPWGRAHDTLLADFLSRQKIPLIKRQAWPLVASGDKILWVAGLRRSVWYPVDPSSSCCLLLTLVPSEVHVDEPGRENNPIPPDPACGKEKQ